MKSTGKPSAARSNIALGGGQVTRKRRAWTRELWELSRELSAFRYRYEPVDLYGLMFFSIYTKLDLETLCALEWDQIDSARRVVRLRATNARSTITFLLLLPASLWRHLEYKRHATERVFPFEPSEVRQGFSRACDKLLIRDLTFDDLLQAKLPRWADASPVPLGSHFDARL